jgi:hypothetical protein
VNVTLHTQDESTETPRPPFRRKFLVAAVTAGTVALAIGLVTGLDLMYYVPVLPRAIALSPEPEQTKRAVLHQVPRGCNIWLAREVMEMNGFTCQMRYGGTFYTTRPSGSQILDFAKKDYLYCVKTEPVVVGISESKYQVAITVKKSVVSDVYVNVEDLPS